MIYKDCGNLNMTLPLWENVYHHKCTEIAVVSNKCDKYITHNICRRIGKTILKTKQPTRHTNRPNVLPDVNRSCCCPKHC